MPFELETAGRDDLDDIMRLVRTTGWPHRAQDVSVALALGDGLKAIQNDTVVGVAMWWTFGAAAGRVGLIIVDPTSQGTGIGRSITERALAAAGPRALRLLATEEGQPLYEKLGFVLTSKHQRHQGVCTAERITNPAIRPPSELDRTQVQALDRRAVGVDRQEVLNHLFDVGEIVVLDAGKGVSGYGVSRSFGHGKVIGPIVAVDETDAIDLFHALLSPGIIRVDRRADAIALGDALEGAGLFGQEVCDEMELGCWPTVYPDRQVFAMASHAWG
jgi:predicted N-acetyltransferase YhbS